MIHLGMADGFDNYLVEKSAWREGTIRKVEGGPPYPLAYYTWPDDAGKTAADLGPCPWTEPQLFTDATEYLAGPGQLHPDPGNYVCGFVAYESLALRKPGTRVLYCHVPGWTDEAGLQRMTEFVCGMIRRAAET